MIKNKFLLVILVCIGFVSADLSSYYDAAELLAHCKTMGMEDSVAQAFLQGPDLGTIKKLYQKAALTCHPDSGGSTAAFQALGSAKEFLTDYAGQSYRVTNFSSSTTHRSYGPSSSNPANYSSSSTRSNYSSYSSSSTSSAGANFYGADYSELNDLKNEIHRIKNTGFKTAKDFEDYSIWEKKFNAWAKKNNVEGFAGPTYSEPTSSKSSGSESSSSSTTTDAGTKSSSAETSTNDTHASKKAGYGFSDYRSRFTSYASSGFKPAPSVARSALKSVTLAFKLGIMGTIGTGVCLGVGYGVYGLKKHMDEQVQQNKDKQVEKKNIPQSSAKVTPSKPAVTTITPSNKRLRFVGGLGAAVVLGVIAYKAYNYYYGNDDLSKKDLPTNKSALRPKKLK